MLVTLLEVDLLRSTACDDMKTTLLHSRRIDPLYRRTVLSNMKKINKSTKNVPMLSPLFMRKWNTKREELCVCLCI